jgi:biopolymer transport protein ExbB
MQGLAQFWAGTDTVGRGVALTLLAMSVAAWMLMLWKAWWFSRLRSDLGQAIPAFWESASLDAARRRLADIDRERALLPLVDAALAPAHAGTLLAATAADTRLTRGLRDAVSGVARRLRSGQVTLASIASTAPFVGLLGTVWGIYHALSGLGGAESLSMERIAGPIGEALVMTAAGIAVAVPALLGYNVLGRRIEELETELEGFAHDLRQAVADGAIVHAP